MVRSAPKCCQHGYGQLLPVSRNQRIEAATRLADNVARLVVLAKSLLGGLRGSWTAARLVAACHSVMLIWATPLFLVM